MKEHCTSSLDFKNKWQNKLLLSTSWSDFGGGFYDIPNKFMIERDIYCDLSVQKMNLIFKQKIHIEGSLKEQ